MQSALQSAAKAHRTVAGVAGSSGRSAEHSARNRRSGPSVRKAAASERPHTFEAVLGQVGSGSPSLVQPGREDVGNIESSFRQSANTKPQHSQAVPSRSRMNQSPTMRVGVARGRGQSAQLRVFALDTTPGTVGAGRPSARRRPANDRTSSKQIRAKSVQVVHRWCNPEEKALKTSRLH